ncbi:hypothetical protein HBI95_241260 [Parastagonospora nodorum]|nr:hypothetical protein HBI95_241260 [Parastagonospora nodorum]
MQEMSRSIAIFGCLRSGEAHMRNMQKMNSVLLPKADAVMVICIECRTGLNFAGHQMRIHTGRASLWHIIEAREDRTWMLHIHTLIEFYFYEHFQTSSQNLQVFRTHTHTDSQPPTPRRARTISRCPPKAQMLVFTLGQQGCLGVHSPSTSLRSGRQRCAAPR